MPSHGTDAQNTPQTIVIDPSTQLEHTVIVYNNRENTDTNHHTHTDQKKHRYMKESIVTES